MHCYAFIAACPAGWQKHNGNCYRKFDKSLSWTSAIAACEAEQAMLAEIKSQQENYFVANTYGGDNWLGISRCSTDSTCLLDLSIAAFTNWAPGEPDNRPQFPPGLPNEQFAAVIQADGTWADQAKLETRSYICKRPG